MASAETQGEAQNLYEAVRSVALDLCIWLGISIPVGKDSLSMLTQWTEANGNRSRVYAPLSLVATAFAALDDVRHAVTPQLQRNFDSTLFLLDLGLGKNRLGMSVLHQTYNLSGGPTPDLDNIASVQSFFAALGELIRNKLVLAYHDRSDGGVFATLCEMSFAGRVGLDIDVRQAVDPVAFFFNEELGVVLQIADQHIDQLQEIFARHGILSLVEAIGKISARDEIGLRVAGQSVYSNTRTYLHRTWSELSYRMQALRDNPATAQQEYDRLLDAEDPGLSFEKSVLASNNEHRSMSIAAPSIVVGKQPAVAILREQGVNGHVEMAAAFAQAGFRPVDVVMVDLVSGDKKLDEYSGVILCGGFSFGDVFGAGRGWANLILQHGHLRDQFQAFFSDVSKFALGVCNGCQVLAELKEMISGVDRWPHF